MGEHFEVCILAHVQLDQPVVPKIETNRSIAEHREPLQPAVTILHTGVSSELTTNIVSQTIDKRHATSNPWK